MTEQNNEDNIYSMKCVICGTPLIESEILKGHRSFNISYVGGYNNPNNASFKGLKCPRGHEYNLADVSGKIKYEEIKIESDIFELLNMDVYNLNLKEIMLNPDTKTYSVDYNFFTKMKADWKKNSRNPSPSNKVLDKVTVYICSKVKSRDLTDKNLVLALASNRIELGKYKYIIIWYEI